MSRGQTEKNHEVAKTKRGLGRKNNHKTKLQLKSALKRHFGRMDKKREEHETAKRLNRPNKMREDQLRRERHAEHMASCMAKKEKSQK